MKRVFSIWSPARCLRSRCRCRRLPAQKKYDTGATDTEIKIGQTNPFSGPASSYATIGKTQAAYIKMINDQGGVNGRKINLIQYDDAYSPPKAVEQVRKLVESDEVLLTFQVLGTPLERGGPEISQTEEGAAAIRRHRRVEIHRPEEFSLTMGFNPNYFVEGRIDGQYILKEYPNAKIGILYQNDDLGKDYLNGIKAGLGDKAAKMVVSEASYEVSDPTIDLQILKIKDAGADLFFSASTPKQAAQAIKKIHELNWKPVHILDINATSVGAVMKPAGLEASKGVISVNYGKDPLDPTWKDDAGMKKYFDFMAKYYPDGDKDSSFNADWVYLDLAADDFNVLEEMRRQPHPRERHEAGHQPEGRRARSARCRASSPTRRRPIIASTSSCR